MRKFRLPALLRRPLVLPALLVFLFCVLLSLWRIHALPDTPRQGEVTGTVEKITGSYLLLKDPVLEENETEEQLKGKVYLKVSGNPASLCTGQRVCLQAELTPLSAPNNPNGWDERTRYLTDGVIYSGTGTLLAVGRAPAPTLRERVRTAFRTNLCALWPEEEDNTLLTALLTGLDEDLSEESSSAFRRSGAAHLLAVSGLHVGFVAALAVLLFSFLRKGSPLQTVLILLSLGAYLLLAESAYSVFRAFIMLAYARLAHLFGRKTDGASALSAAVLAALLCRPEQSLCAGFLLSTSAVLGILLLNSRLNELLRRLLPLNFVRESVCLTLSSQLGVLPVQLLFFHTLNPLSLLTNLAAVPLSAGIVTLGLPAALLQGILPGLASVLALPTRVLLHMLTALCGTVSSSPAALLCAPAPSALMILAYLILLWFLSPYSDALAHRARPFGRITACVLLLCSAALWLPGATARPTQAVFLSVGTADSTLLRSPGGNVLLDTGWTGSQAVRALQGDGLTLDALILTHGDSDHTGGLENLLRSVRVRAVYIPAGLSLDTEELSGAKELLTEMHIPLYELKSGDQLNIGSFSLRILSPDCVREGKENEDSLVTEVTCNGHRLLFLGDIPISVEDRLSLQSCDVVKLAHHGSASSTGDRMLSAVQPRAAILSVGTPNRYGFPRREVLDRLAAHGIPAYRTDENGAILADLSGEEVTLSACAPPTLLHFLFGLS